MCADLQEIRTPFHEFEMGFKVIIDLIVPGTRVWTWVAGPGPS